MLRRTVVALVAASLTLAASVLPAQADDAPATPTKLRIVTSDGTDLAATLTAADATARPTGVEFTPYGEGGASFSFGPDYNFLSVQVRGTADSTGAFGVLGPDSQRDVVDVLRW